MLSSLANFIRGKSGDSATPPAVTSENGIAIGLNLELDSFSAKAAKCGRQQVLEAKEAKHPSDGREEADLDSIGPDWVIIDEKG